MKVWTDDPPGKEIWAWCIKFLEILSKLGGVTACYSWLHKSTLERVHMAHSVDAAHTPRMCESVQHLLSQALAGMDGRMCGPQTFIAHLYHSPLLLASGVVS